MIDQTAYQQCELCPRRCGVDRRKAFGFCRAGDAAVLASAVLHAGEEPPLSGHGGSGTLFFSGCTLGCPFCQNIQISHPAGKGQKADQIRRMEIFSNAGTPPLTGKPVTDEELAEICLKLQEAGAENINLVTGTHFIPSISAALLRAKDEGLHIPVVWNTSGFERTEILEQIDPLIDIYLTDLKTLDADTAEHFCRSRTYPKAAETAVKWMMSAKSLEAPDSGMMRRGVIVRHLLFPGELGSTEQVLRWFAENGRDRALLSMMVQFITPFSDAAGASPLNLNSDERDSENDGQNLQHDYDRILELLDELDIEEGFIQEPGDDVPWIPDFSRANPFPQEFSRPVWHWRHGMADHD